jgi:acyl-CoA synthetase (NDP forming)
MDMMREIKGHKILDAVRGMKAADTNLLKRMLISLGQLGLDFPDIMEIDLNPVILAGDKPVVVDALIVLKGKE